MGDTFQIGKIKASVLSEITTVMNGLTFVPATHESQTPRHCGCAPRSACPRLCRHTNDSYCAFMRIFTDAESNSLGYISVDKPCLPLVLWGLAGRDKTCPGFSIRFT